MPWANYAEAKQAAPGLVSVRPNAQSKPQPVRNKGALDALAAIYDAVQARGGVENAAAVAKATFVKSWRHKGKGVWAKRTPLSKEVAVSEVQVPFASYATLVKSYEEGGKRYVVYACADDGPDLEKAEVRGQRTIADVIDLTFLEKMAQENVAKAVPLVATHQDPFQDECPLGKAVESWVEPAGSTRFGKKLEHNTLLTKFELTDGDPRAEVLWKQGAAGGDARGTSVHGGITRIAVELAKNAAGYVRRILDGHVDHHAIIVPGRAANPRMGMVAAMSKALQESGAEIATPDLEKAEVKVWGGDECMTGYVKTEDDAYTDPWPVGVGFNETLAAIRIKVEAPRLAGVFRAVVDRIIGADTDDVPNKGAALAKAADEYQAALDRLMAQGDLSKAQVEELADEAAALLGTAEPTTEIDAQTAAGEPAAEDGGTAAKEAIPMAEQTLEKALDPKAVGAMFQKFARAINPLLKLMGGGDEDALPEGEGEATVETVEKSLQEIDAGVGRFALLSKGFVAQLSLDPAAKAKADAEARVNEAGETPVKGALGMAPGAMSKAQIDEFAEALKAQGYVLTKAEAAPSAPVVAPEPPADEIDRVAKLLANEGLVKAALGKLDGATREALNKALSPQSAQPPADAAGEDPFAALKASPRSDPDFYSQFLRSKAPQ